MAVTRASNVRVLSANGDSISGEVLKIRTIIVKPGSGTPTCTLSITGPQGTVTVFDAGAMSASGASQAFYETLLYVGQGQTLTATMSGTGTAVYLYVG
jgi:hypothetical protein